MRVGAISEEELLAIIIPRLPRGRDVLVGPGDDAAVLAVPGRRMVVTTDVLVQGRHFDLRWGTGADLGYRAAMQNLADVAAMGARPTSIVVALVLPSDREVAWLADLADGLAQACDPHEVGVVGGDLTAGESVIVAVTAHGVLDDGEPMLRSGARPGDVVAVSGVLGRSRAGLELLRSDPDAGQHTSAGAGPQHARRADALASAIVHPAAKADLVRAYLRPESPLAQGPIAGRAGATALMDVSDGLLRDAGRLAQASGVVLNLRSAVLADDLAAVADVAGGAGVDPLSWVLTGGEDHALLATFPPSGVIPDGFRQIGTVHEPGDIDGPAVLLDGGLPPGEGIGWDHFGG